jgi:hypothetical protein
MKNHTSYLVSVAVLTLGLFAASGHEAHAYYIDPGSGSYLFQMAIAGVLGGFYAFRQAFGKWRPFTKKRK